MASGVVPGDGGAVGVDGRRLLVAVATYNERENLPSLIEAIRDRLPRADVLVIDDNSPDGTGDWCNRRAAEDDRFSVLHRPAKQGLGSAAITALRHAVAHGYTAVATMDADWSHDPADLPRLVRRLDGADVVIGSRYCPGGRIEGWPVGRRAVSAAMNAVTRMLLRLPARDTSGAFRVYRTGALRRVDLAGVGAAGYAYLEELLWRLHRSGVTLAETPITFRERRAGRSKVSLAELRGKLTMLARCAGRTPTPDAPREGGDAA